MKTFIHLLSVLILSVVLYACNNAHFLKEENYRNQVTEDFEAEKAGTSSWRPVYCLFRILTCLYMSRKL